MFDVGFWEMAFIGVIALVVIGPQRLPGAARTAGMWVGKARRMIAEVKSDIKREMDQHDTLSEMTDLKRELSDATREINDATGNNDPLGIKRAGASIKKSVEDVSTTLKEAEKEASAMGAESAVRSDAKEAGKKKKVTKKVTGKKISKKRHSKKKAARVATSGHSDE